MCSNVILSLAIANSGSNVDLFEHSSEGGYVRSPMIKIEYMTSMNSQLRNEGMWY